LGFLALLVNTAYIAAFASPTIFYMSNVLLHVVLGTALFIAAIFLIARNAELRRRIAPAFGFFLAALLAALYLAAAGNIREHRWALWAHVIAAVLGIAALIPFAWKRPAFRIAAAVLVLLPLSTWLYRRAFPDPNDRIRNSHRVPASMDEEGGGPASPFFPS